MKALPEVLRVSELAELAAKAHYAYLREPTGERFDQASNALRELAQARKARNIALGWERADQ